MDDDDHCCLFATGNLTIIMDIKLGKILKKGSESSNLREPGVIDFDFALKTILEKTDGFNESGT